MDDGVRITLVMNVKAEFVAQIKEGMAKSLPETRVYPGCRSVHAFLNDDDPNQLILLEHWDSREAYAAYTAWRRESGAFDRTDLVMTSPPEPQFWSTKLA